MSEMEADPSAWPSPPLPVGRRRWLRFSLRTLVLAVLLIGSGATLWWKWEPWQFAYGIAEPGEICDAGFSPDGKYVYTLTHPQDDPNNSTVTLRHSADGRVHQLLRSAKPGESVSFSTAGNYLLLYVGVGASYDDGVNAIWRVADGAEIKWPEGFWRYRMYFSMNEDYVAGLYYPLGNNPARIARFPDFTPLFDVKDFQGFAHRSAGIIALTEESTDLLALPKGEKARQWRTDGRPIHARPSPDDSAMAIDYMISPYQSRSIIFDAVSGEKGMILPGMPIDEWREPCYSADAKFLKLVGENSRAVVWDLERHKRVPVPATFGKEIYRTELRDGLIIDANGPRVWDARSERMLWERSGARGFVPRGSACAAVGRKHKEDYVVEQVVSARTGKPMIDFTDLRWSKRIGFTVRGVEMDRTEKYCFCSAVLTRWPNGDSRAAVFRKGRPEEWYGVAWLWEFWATVVLGVAVVWSVWRDRRMR